MPPPEGGTTNFALRLGLRMLFGLPIAQGEQIVARRGKRPFASMDDFARRTGLSRAAIARLAKAGAFGSLGTSRRRSLWDALGEDNRPLPLFDEADCEEGECEAVNGTLDIDTDIDLPLMSPQEEVLYDYRTQGLSLRAHPLEFLRAELESLGVTPARGLATWPNGRRVCVAGLVLVRQRPSTAKGITFVTLEDETGTANLIIRPHIWQRYRPAALSATVLMASGVLQREGLNIHVLVSRLEDFSVHMDGMLSQSRDFC